MPENIAGAETHQHLSYGQFASAYNRLIGQAVAAWQDERQAAALANTEQMLTEIDQQYPYFADRAALLGREWGGLQ